MDFRQHTVLVTGGTSGIGAALARAFHAAGSRVIAAGRDPVRLEALAASLPGLESVRVDLTAAAAREEFAEEIGRRFPNLSVLVNNAGVQFPATVFPAEPNPEAAAAFLGRAREEIEVNCSAVVDLTVRLFPLLRSAPASAVVFLSSGLAIAPRKGAPVYCASKAFVRTFARALRYQCEDEAPQVQVMDVIPPVVETPMTAGRGCGKIPPEEVAAATLAGLRRKKTEVAIGKVRILRLVHRLLPAVAYRILRDA